MKRFFNPYAFATTFTLVIIAMMTSCNRDNSFGFDGKKPEIILDNEYGIYSVKVGHRLTVAPEFTGIASGGDVSWIADGKVIGHGLSWSGIMEETGVRYLTVSAENEFGRSTEEIRIDVLELTPPVISFAVPDRGLKVQAGKELRLDASVHNPDDCGELLVVWSVNGRDVCRDKLFVFSEDKPGIYELSIYATNDDGTSQTDFQITVTEGVPYSVWFPTHSYRQRTTSRYTFAGRPAFLRPELENFTRPVFRWLVDGRDADFSGRTFKFVPTAAGTYSISVVVSEEGDEASAVEATVYVVAVNATESSRQRQPGGASRPEATRVFEFTPAPGQFIGDTATDGMPGEGSAAEDACIWAEKALNRNQAVSLGSFGGCIIVGFDHSIVAGSAEYELAVGGNAFMNANGTGSNEPGIVRVMQDVNGNGMPDDQWYELRGSEYDNASTTRDYSVTYFRPGGDGMSVKWTDSDGMSGEVQYMGAFHSQPSYYPGWIGASSYTLRGTKLQARNVYSSEFRQWINKPYPWGYADNIGSDNIARGDGEGSGQKTGFKISNAVFDDGTPVNLQYIDFVMVQSAVLAQSGSLGEVSTEVSGIFDNSMTK